LIAQPLRSGFVSCRSNPLNRPIFGTVGCEIERLLKVVGLEKRFVDAYPREVSGGECQRAAIARAIAQKSRLLICDEATSALDVSVQAQVVELLNNIRLETGISYLFISHDLALVSSFCDRTYVLYGGRVVEEGVTSRIIQKPEQEYTKRLLSSVLTVEHKKVRIPAEA
jgi:peptide/nickel transport system ATP-binding protein